MQVRKKNYIAMPIRWRISMEKMKDCKNPHEILCFRERETEKSRKRIYQWINEALSLINRGQ